MRKRQISAGSDEDRLARSSADAAASAFGEPRRRRRFARRPAAAIVAARLLIFVVVLGFGGTGVYGLLGIGRPDCDAAGIGTTAAREGICQRGATLFGGGTVYNVVDAGHTLKMPGYHVRLLGLWTGPTHVTNPQVDPGAYPNAQGLLVSFELSVQNTTPAPLRFDVGGSDVDLLLANTSTSFRDLVNPADGPPGTSIADENPIAPHATAIGWVTFVSPVWVRSVLHLRASDLEFSPPGRPNGYVGQIRLWKWATAQGRAALGLDSPVLSSVARPRATAGRPVLTRER